MAEKGVPG
jgi:predicted phage-related endonuclease